MVKANKNLAQGVDFSHYLCQQHLESGDLVVDATAGNGHDTVFLARLVGDEGRVLAFDIQQPALEETEQRLREKGLGDRVKLIHDGHEHMEDYLNHKPISGLVFNLGYLPGGDKDIITRPGTTIKALTAGLKLMKSGGLAVVVIYSGHSGGEREKREVLEYTSQLSHKSYNVLHYHFLNQQSSPPEVVAIKKRQVQKKEKNF